MAVAGRERDESSAAIEEADNGTTENGEEGQAPIQRETTLNDVHTNRFTNTLNLWTSIKSTSQNIEFGDEARGDILYGGL